MHQFIEFILRGRLLMVVLGAIVIGAGWFSYRGLQVDAFPDVTPSMVQVFAVTEGLAPEEVEKFVTYPIEVAMNGLPSEAIASHFDRTVIERQTQPHPDDRVTHPVVPP